MNLPRRPRGLRWTRQSVRHYAAGVVPAQDPWGRPCHRIAPRPVEETEEGTDRWTFEQGWVSMTPLRLDLTDHGALAAARERDGVE